MSIQRILTLLLLASGCVLLFLAGGSHASPAEDQEDSLEVRIVVPCDDFRGSPATGEVIDTDVPTGCYSSQTLANAAGLAKANHALHNATTNKHKCADCDIPEKCKKTEIVANYTAADCQTQEKVGGGPCGQGEKYYETKCSANLVWKVSCSPCL